MANSPSSATSNAIAVVLNEILNGASPQGGWLLNRGDPGLLPSLDRLTAEQASAVPARGTPSIAAHVEHLRYGLDLLNRSAREENPFASADWSAAWRVTDVTPAEWSRLRDALHEVSRNWLENHAAVQRMGERELTGVIASAAHLAYHLGAIRQLCPAARGPSAEEEPPSR